MKSYLGLSIFLILSACSSHRRFLSPFESEVDGLHLYNASWIDPQEKKLLRSMEPYEPEHFQELKDLGVTDVLIFKDSKDGALGSEYEKLKSVGISASNIHNIPFKWKDIENFREACEQTLQGLRLMRDIAEQKSKRLLLHCTVGEDRTGYLTGLYTLMQDPTQDIATVFQEEMCENGYSSGNPEKPIEKVALPIDQNLTPLFIKMSFQIKTSKLTRKNIDSNLCATEPAQSAKFIQFRNALEPKLFCKPSTRYKPGIRS